MIFINPVLHTLCCYWGATNAAFTTALILAQSIRTWAPLYHSWPFI